MWSAEYWCIETEEYIDEYFDHEEDCINWCHEHRVDYYWIRNGMFMTSNERSKCEAALLIISRKQAILQADASHFRNKLNEKLAT